jgi:hypothetical protein
LAAGPFAASRKERFESEVGPGDVRIGNHPPEEVARWRLPVVSILNHHLETASAAWQAYRAPTPRTVHKFLTGLPSTKPFIARVRVNTEPSAKLPPVRSLLHRKPHKLAPLIHHRHLTPWHGLASRIAKSMHYDVSAMSPNTCR